MLTEQEPFPYETRRFEIMDGLYLVEDRSPGCWSLVFHEKSGNCGTVDLFDNIGLAQKAIDNWIKEHTEEPCQKKPQ